MSLISDLFDTAGIDPGEGASIINQLDLDLDDLHAQI